MRFSRTDLIRVFFASLLFCTIMTFSYNQAVSNQENDVSQDKHQQAVEQLRQSPLLVRPLVSEQNRLALQLFTAITASKNDNSLCSPWSIWSALSLVEPGGRGKTADEMRQLLFGSAAIDESLLQLSRDALQSTDFSQGYELRVGNAAWVQQGLNLKPNYLQALQVRGVDEPAFMVDFIRAPGAAVDAINQWVDKQTAEMIPKLLEAGDIDSETRLVLTNAIYFNGRWTEPFKSERTAKLPFFVAADNQVNVDQMQGKFDIRYADLADVTIGALPYGEVADRMELLLVIPKQADGLENVRSDLSGETLQTWLNALQPKNGVQVQLPKFKFRSRTELADTLSSLGIPTAFDANQADFSGMTADERLVISKVIHEAVVELDEQGTKAAAATAVIMMRATAMVQDKPLRLIADRPFLFIIRDQLTGTILFIGQLADPNAAQ